MKQYLNDPLSELTSDPHAFRMNLKQSGGCENLLPGVIGLTIKYQMNYFGPVLSDPVYPYS